MARPKGWQSGCDNFTNTDAKWDTHVYTVTQKTYKIRCQDVALNIENFRTMRVD